MENLKFWTNNLINTLEKEIDEETSKKVIESCGRICANECGAVKEVEELIKSIEDTDNIDLIVEKMNKAGIAGGKLKREGNTIIGIYEQCYCPSRKFIESGLYCRCTQGWAKEVFEKLLGKDIDVVLEKAIGWGDDICRFVVKY